MVATRRGIGCIAVAGLLSLASCRDNPADPASPDDPLEENPDWTEATHGEVPPAYGVVFPQDAVNRLEIVMTSADWAAVRSNMKALTGVDFGAGATGPGHNPSADPAYISVTVRFDQKRWTRVGFRLKGNSSLGSAWNRGIYKLPFRLNFDRFEDAYPAIHNQRFYGFSELSMSPGFADNSLIREKSGADIFNAAGVPAAHTAFYRVYIDFGAGLKYCGVYTMVEVIDDTMVDDAFAQDQGNLYKPESRLQSFSQAQFEKKNNVSQADWSDIQAFLGALNSSLRTSNPEQWRANLEARFDVDHFLRWLAVSNAIVNWDSYGSMPHNYYLYHHSTRGIVWIPWDHNETLIGSPGITGSVGVPPGPKAGLSLTMNEVTPAWPLIRFLLDDTVYSARYRELLRAFRDQVFTTEAMDALFERYHALIAPWVTGPDGEQPGYTFLPGQPAFVQALGELATHVQNRRALLAQFLP